MRAPYTKKVLHFKFDRAQQQVAWHLTDEIAREENASTKAVDRIGKAEVAFHLQCSEADVYAIEIGKHITKKKQRNQTPADFL